MEESVPPPTPQAAPVLLPLKRIALIVLMIMVLPALVLATRMRNLINTQADTSTISSVQIAPGMIQTSPQSAPIFLSAQAVDVNLQPVNTAVNYLWGMSSTNSIGTIIPNADNPKIAEFRASGNEGVGDIWVRATSGSSEAMSSIPVQVGTIYPTPTPPAILTTPTFVPTPTPTKVVPTNYPTPTPTPTRIAPTSTPLPPTPTTLVTRPSSVSIFAAGTQAYKIYPNMTLEINGARVANWSNVRGNPALRLFQTYTYTHPTTISSTDLVRVHFTNDGYQNSRNDRNLFVDRIVIDGRTYQSESPTTYSVGVYTESTGCAAGYKNSEKLSCNGYFQYRLSQ